MSIEFKLTKLVVADVEKLASFYLALGFKLVESRLGENATGKGMSDVTQEQMRLSETGDSSSHLLVLARFTGFPPPTGGAPYPGPYWLVMHTADVDASAATAARAGGRIARPAETVTHQGTSVRAAIVCDPEGNFIELYGPAEA